MTTLIDHLHDRYKARFTDTVATLRSAVDAGLVPNALFTDAKDVINRAIAEGVENFLATGPRVEGHSQSGWWSAAYHADALNVSAHLLPSAIKRATKHTGLREYVTFLQSLTEYASLLDAAKPLIVKRGDARMPKVKTAKQIEREAECMTCQCCGRSIFAQTGTIAHHGYERPGTGWQTPSCVGAKELPWEVSRDALGKLIEMLGVRIDDLKAHAKAVKAETVKVPFHYVEYVKDSNRYTSTKVNHKEMFDRAGYEAAIARVDEDATSALDKALHTAQRTTSFNQLLERELMNTESMVVQTRTFKRECEKRFAGWKQTHSHFDKATGKWVAL